MGTFLPVTSPKIIYNSNTQETSPVPLTYRMENRFFALSPQFLTVFNPKFFFPVVPSWTFLQSTCPTHCPSNPPHTSHVHTFWPSPSLKWLASSSETLVPSSVGLTWSPPSFHGSSVWHLDHTLLISYVSESCSRSICLVMSSLLWMQLDSLRMGVCVQPFWNPCHIGCSVSITIGTHYLLRTQHSLPQICLD